MFCESCGQSIADTLAECPYCHEATGIVAASGPSGAAAVAVRAPIAAQKPLNSKLSRVEQSVYFRFARGFSWFLLVVISVGIIRLLFALAPVMIQMFGSSTAVNAQELGRANAGQQRSGQFGQEEEKMDPSQMARLDQAAYEIIQLLPASERQGNIDYVRGQIRNSAANLVKEQKNQLAILEELRDDLKALPDAQRANAVGVYFVVKGQKIHQDQAKKEEAEKDLTILGASLVSSIALLTFVTIILVLLSIERNTRVAAA
jgi:hypothetical protein